MLLFWDIIFSPVPGAFETPYQTAPLDLWSDAFYVERIGVINERLDLIGQVDSSMYLDIIRRVDDKERPLQTLCAGVNWNYEQVHLLEIAEVRQKKGGDGEDVIDLEDSMIFFSVWGHKLFHHFVDYWLKNLVIGKVACLTCGK